MASREQICLEERSKAAGSGHQKSPPHDNPAGEAGSTQVDSEMQNAGATHSPSRHSPSPPLDGQGPHDEHKNCNNDSHAGDNDDMQVDHMGTGQCGGRDIQSPGAGRSPSPSLDPNAASDNHDMQVDAITLNQSAS